MQVWGFAFYCGAALITLFCCVIVGMVNSVVICPRYCSGVLIVWFVLCCMSRLWFVDGLCWWSLFCGFVLGSVFGLVLLLLVGCMCWAWLCVVCWCFEGVMCGGFLRFGCLVLGGLVSCGFVSVGFLVFW